MRDYGKVSVGFWTDDKMIALSVDARLLALYLLSGPHTNSIGCFRLPSGYISADLFEPLTPQRAQKRATEALKELENIGFIQRDPQSGWTLICNFLRYNAPENGNVGIRMAKDAAKIPASLPFFDAVLACLETVCERLPKGFLEQLRQPSPNNSPIPEPEPEPQPKPEPKTKAQTEPQSGPQSRHPPALSSPSEKALFEAKGQSPNPEPAVKLGITAQRKSDQNDPAIDTASCAAEPALAAIFAAAGFETAVLEKPKHAHSVQKNLQIAQSWLDQNIPLPTILATITTITNRRNTAKQSPIKSLKYFNDAILDAATSPAPSPQQRKTSYDPCASHPPYAAHNATGEPTGKAAFVAAARSLADQILSSEERRDSDGDPLQTLVTAHH